MARRAEGHSAPPPRARDWVKAEHVWVCVTGTWGDTAYPGLLLEWRRTTGGPWEALVIWVFLHSGGWDVRQGWVPAAHVRRRRDSDGVSSGPGR